MQTLPENLKKLIDLSKEQGWALETPASDEGIDGLNKKIMQLYSHPLPEEYIAFLKIMNGFSDFGMMIYATKDANEMQSDSDIYDILEIIENIAKEPLQRIHLGESGGDLFVYDVKDKIFYVVDHAGNINETHDSFFKLVDGIARNLL